MYWALRRLVKQTFGRKCALPLAMVPSRIWPAPKLDARHLSCSDGQAHPELHLRPTLDHLGLKLSGFRQIDGLVPSSCFMSMIGDLFPITLWGRPAWSSDQWRRHAELFESRHANTLRVAKSIIATRYKTPRALECR